MASKEKSKDDGNLAKQAYLAEIDSLLSEIQQHYKPGSTMTVSNVIRLLTELKGRVK